MRKAALLIQFLACEGGRGPAEFQEAKVEWLRPERILPAFTTISITFL